MKIKDRQRGGERRWHIGIGLVVAVVALVGCEPTTCNYENDGQCDVDIGTCPVGTDTADCTGDSDDSCRYANDGECDDGTYCPVGTDKTDCSDPDDNPDNPETPDTIVGCGQDPNEAWKGNPRTSIQITAFCSQACNSANVVGKDHYQVGVYCDLMFALMEETGPPYQTGHCPVCDGHQ